MFENFLPYWQQTIKWQPTLDQAQQFAQVYDLVLEGNKIQNLTRITAIEDFWEKHLWDSLRGVLPIWNQENLQAIDIGTGAGFPGIPIAIAHPSWQLTLLDSRLKKTAFIDTVIQTMSLSNVTSLTGRAEQLNTMGAHSRQYDLALVRAVGNVGLCVAYAIPFVKSGGMIVLYRGQWTDSEQTELTASLPRSVTIKQVDQFTTPLTDSMRHCIYLTL